MKKILLIIAFAPFITYGQISITGASNGYQTLGIGSVNNQSWNPGDLIIYFTGTTNSGGTPANVSLSGTGQTWTQIDNKLNIAGDYRIQAFRFAPTTAAAANATTNFTYTGTQDGGWAISLRVTGANVTGTNGSNAIRQFVNDAQNSSANPSLTLSSLLSNSQNAVICGFINDQSPFGGAPESGWTEYGESGYSSPTTGGYSMFRVSTADNTPTVTASSSNWAGISIELNGNVRRRIRNVN